jgi:hypothetical protein
MTRPVDRSARRRPASESSTTRRSAPFRPAPEFDAEPSRHLAMAARLRHPLSREEKLAVTNSIARRVDRGPPPGPTRLPTPPP